MDTPLFLLMILLFPVVFSCALIKALQAPAVPHGRVELNSKERDELLYWAFCLPRTITPFPSDTHQEQETTQQSE